MTYPIAAKAVNPASQVASWRSPMVKAVIGNHSTFINMIASSGGCMMCVLRDDSRRDAELGGYLRRTFCCCQLEFLFLGCWCRATGYIPDNFEFPNFPNCLVRSRPRIRIFIAMKEWHTAHFISSEHPAQTKYAVIVLNQPIALELSIFRRIWDQG